MQNTTKFVGLDVSKERIAVAVADAGRETPRSLGSIENSPEAIRKLMKKLGDAADLEVCYEAGSTGYGLYRQLKKMGISCLVAAPSLIPKRQGDRVKTDRRDALRLAQLLRSGELTAVWVPTEEDEALRDLVRARADTEEDRTVRADFHGKQFSNATHRSVTDPDARLYKKGRGQEAHLRYLIHNVTDVRSGVSLSIEIPPLSAVAI